MPSIKEQIVNGLKAGFVISFLSTLVLCTALVIQMAYQISQI